MKLVEALQKLSQPQPVDGDCTRVGLVCSFNALHLRTFLEAELRCADPSCRIEVHSGLYGDFWGTLSSVSESNTDVAVVLMEWADLDPRLGLRSLGNWLPETLPDILHTAKSRKGEFLEAVRGICTKVPLVVSLPTLPLPPFSFSSGWYSSSSELELKACISSLALDLIQFPNIKVLNGQRVDLSSPLGDRLDCKSDLATGFPYKLSHASTLAKLLTFLIRPPVPKKGLITDLDDTLWAGILGEVGEDGISWDLEHNTHIHGMYQRFLHSLSGAGILVGIASKNDPEIVRKALSRKDLLLPERSVFPVDAHWGPKSESIGRILKTWNVGPESVIFVDDSPMEIAEVQAIHPQVECVLFPGKDPQKVQELLYDLRDLFGKTAVSNEDKIRKDSIRLSRPEVLNQSDGNGVTEEFLAQAESEIVFEYSKDPPDPRSLELINKTNQFNLNGKRYTESSWMAYLREAETVLVVASYQDKYGPLGKIAVTCGRRVGSTLNIDSFVMSCRAFSRRIEYRVLEELFERFEVRRMVFDFQPTSRNGPVQAFLTDILGVPTEPHCELTYDQFYQRRRMTYHRVKEVVNG